MDKLYYLDGTTSSERDDSKTLHREDGPAVIRRYSDDGIMYSCWYMNGMKHRIDGPAAEYGDGSKRWYIEGTLLLGNYSREISPKEPNFIPQYALINYMRTNNLTVAHLLTDPDPLVRESAALYEWTDATCTG